MKVQVQLYGDNIDTKYTNFNADVIPNVGHTLIFDNKRYEVKSVTWMLFVGLYQEQKEVHISAELLNGEFSS